MSSSIAFAAVLLLGLAAPVEARTQGKVTPIQKVIQMLSEMSSKGQTEKNMEETEFAKFKAWCEDIFSDKAKSIAEAKAKVDQLSADIAKAESDAKVLGEEIAALEADVATYEEELKNATEIRAKENADYTASHQDYSESIDALERAIQVLKQRTADVPQSLLQLKASSGIPDRAKAVISSFLAIHEQQVESLSAPEANAYEFQSGGVVAMLEKLLEQFQDERFALEKAEMNAKANFELLAQKLTDQIDTAEANIKERTVAKAERLAAAADAKGELEKTQAVLAEDEKMLSDTLAECKAKSDEYEQNQVTRSEEIKAIEKAIEIMSSPAVSGNAEKHLPTLVQAATSLAQLRGIVTTNSQVQVSQFLRERAARLGSRYLALAAARAAADPFKKVKKMIKDLIVKLMEEANAEADHKAFCDTELATNKQTRDNLSAEVDKLTANIDEKTAEAGKLASEIKSLSDALAEIKRLQAEATTLRQEEKEKNAAIVADAKEGTAAVEAALKVLKDFYDKAAGSSLLQGENSIKQDMAAAAPYKGQQDQSTGVIGMLEVILSDFARLEAETSSGEDAAASAYDKFMDESNEDAAVKQTEVDHKTLKKERTEAALADLKKDLEATQEELNAAMDYYDKLKPDCVDMGLSYEDRVARRKEEIVSLQEALRILTGEEIA